MVCEYLDVEEDSLPGIFRVVEANPDAAAVKTPMTASEAPLGLA
ncbi:hypothetical protein [Mycobacterium parmense]|nr:hypothetical protein [Mycobacterium parmense]